MRKYKLIVDGYYGSIGLGHIDEDNNTATYITEGFAQLGMG
jgi:hypothetical protein